MPNNQVELSIVIPIYNEAAGLTSFHASLTAVLKKSDVISYEIIYVDDGSTDQTIDVIKHLNTANKHIKYLPLSRNFGKESAITAGIKFAKGDAIMLLDGDGQHPVELIPKFIDLWLKGNKVVVGIRRSNTKEGLTKKAGSYLFYKTFNMLTKQKLIPGSTDFRLIDKTVRTAFLELKEVDRINRGLIDWLGFKTDYIEFDANPRIYGGAGYNFRKLIKLAIDSYVGFSNAPLYFFGYLGAVISVLSFLLGVIVFIEQVILGDPLAWKFTGTAMLAILIIFLVGLMLTSQGIMSLYVSLTYAQSKGRPLYVIDYDNSIGIIKESGESSKT
jgi:dolichol-phosphate mannosyltransferase